MFPSSLSFETTGKVNILCINCPFKNTRDWHGRIIGNGIHGSLNALFLRMRFKLLKDMPLWRLLTICAECGEEGQLVEKNCKAWINQTLNCKDIGGDFGNITLSLLYQEEVEEIMCSRKIILEGVLKDKIKTDTRQEAWDLLNPLFKI